MAAREGADEEVRGALAELCRTYWYPIYAYIRRSGQRADAALDLTQDFFVVLLEKELLASVTPSKGRFRAFLFTSCKNFLSNRRVRDRARKRGGGRPVVSIDTRDAEGRYLREPSHSLTPEKLFDRRWALTLLENTLGALEHEMRAAGKSALFDQLAPALLDKGQIAPYARIALELNMTENAVKLAAYRLRSRFRELLTLEVGRTVNGRDEVDDELRGLFSAFA